MTTTTKDAALNDTAEMWEQWLEQTDAKYRTPQSAMSFAADRYSARVEQLTKALEGFGRQSRTRKGNSMTDHSEATGAHTAGLWHASRKRYYVNDQRNLVIAELDVKRPEFAANALLIAAAPELLRCLQQLHDDIAEYARINNLGGYDNHVMRQARSAIALAHGEAQTASDDRSVPTSNQRFR